MGRTSVKHCFLQRFLQGMSKFDQKNFFFAYFFPYIHADENVMPLDCFIKGGFAISPTDLINLHILETL